MSVSSSVTSFDDSDRKGAHRLWCDAPLRSPCPRADGEYQSPVDFEQTDRSSPGPEARRPCGRQRLEVPVADPICPTTLPAMTNRPAAVHPPPLWARWVLASVIAAGAIAAIVIAVDRAGPEPASSETQIEAEDNRIADLAITEDEAPHSAALPAGSLPRTALERAIGSDVRHRIAGGQLTGPLQRVECKSPVRSSSPARKPYRCTARSD